MFLEGFGFVFRLGFLWKKLWFVLESGIVESIWIMLLFFFMFLKYWVIDGLFVFIFGLVIRMV